MSRTLSPTELPSHINQILKSELFLTTITKLLSQEKKKNASIFYKIPFVDGRMPLLFSSIAAAHLRALANALNDASII